MNLSAKVLVNTGGSGGETLTVTCYTCGMPSSKEWAQKTRSRPNSPNKPFFPFLLQLIPPHGAHMREDGSTYLCAFCHASLESQWNNHEQQGNMVVPPMNRKYIMHKFICAVCSVETYRKRVRALPFQEFPFLVSKRQPGSLTLGNNPLAVVCLDCSETLWSQSSEYERWGLPIHKRHFNWMARPPPPEDSVEATVARLPSGETQLPRCPPTEPLIPPRFSQPCAQPESVTPVKAKPKISKAELTQMSSSSRNSGRPPVVVASNLESHNINQGRKASLNASSASIIDVVATAPSQGPSQPPVVTVAPMSTYNTLSNTRKETMSVPPNLMSAFPKYDGIPQPCGIQHLGPPSLFSRSSMFPPGPSSNYSTFPWSGRDPPYHYSGIPNTMESLTASTPTSSWSWLQSPAPDLLRYQSFMTSFHGRGYGDIYLNPSSHLYGGRSPTNLSGSTGAPDPGGPYLSPYRLQSSLSSSPTPTPPQQLPHSNTMTSSSHLHGQLSPTYHPNINESTNDPIVSSEYDFDGSTLNVHTADPNYGQGEVMSSKLTAPAAPPKKNLPTKSSKLPSDSSSLKSSSPPKKPKNDSAAAGNHVKTFKGEPATPTTIGSSRTTPYTKSEEREHYIISSATMKDKSEGYVGKKWQWQSHVKNNEKLPGESSTSSEPMDCSLKSGSTSMTNIAANIENISDDENEHECAIDLSVSSTSSSTAKTPQPVDDVSAAATPVTSSSNKFMIAYLCKSESISPSLLDIQNSNEDRDGHGVSALSEKESPGGRSSVIVSASKSDALSESVVEGVEGAVEGLLGEPEAMKNSKYENHEVTSCETVEKPRENVIADVNDPEIHSKSGDEEKCFLTTNPKPNDASNETSVVSEDHSQNTNQSSQDVQNFMETQCAETAGQRRQYLNKMLEEFKQRKILDDKVLMKKDSEKKCFLAELGLITAQQRTEFELEILISRCEHKTLPPLRLRVGSPPSVVLREEFEQLLLQIAFDDPSLKQCTNNPDKSSFLDNLGLKPASKSEKIRRESEWRMMLTERMMREKRDKRLRGCKRPWDSYADVSNLLVPKRRFSNSDSQPSVLETLSLTMPADIMTGSSAGCHTGSSDLLTTVENRETLQTEAENHANNKDSTSVIIKNGMSIVYPKYVPSYALPSAAVVTYSKYDDSLPQPKILSILNVPMPTLSGHYQQPFTGKLDNSTDAKDNSVSADNNQLAVVQCTNILKIPVINPGLVRNLSRRDSNTSCPTDDTSDLTSSDEAETTSTPYLSTSDLVQTTTTVVKTEVEESNSVNSIIMLCTNNWKHTRGSMEAFIASPSEPKTVVTLTERAENVRKLRKYCKAQQTEIKSMERILKFKEKQIVKQIRALAKNTQTKK